MVSPRFKAARNKSFFDARRGQMRGGIPPIYPSGAGDLRRILLAEGKAPQ